MSTKDAASGQKRMRPQPWWLIFLVVMGANYLVTRVFFPEPASIKVSYTFFKKQVEAGNVAYVTSAGDSIRGSFKKELTYLPEMQEPFQRAGYPMNIVGPPQQVPSSIQYSFRREVSRGRSRPDPLWEPWRHLLPSCPGRTFALPFTDPRNPRSTPLFQLVEAHYEHIKKLWEDRFENTHGRWQGFTDTVVARFLDCASPECGGPASL